MLYRRSGLDPESLSLPQSYRPELASGTHREHHLLKKQYYYLILEY